MMQEPISAGPQRDSASTAGRRTAGRPTREQAEARHLELLEAALGLFLEHGYNSATIEMIAAQVGMTKRTIYARYPDKAALFHAAVQRAIEQHTVPRKTLEGLDNGDLAETLAAVARLRIGQVMTPRGLRLHRIINTESYRFPEIFTTLVRQSTRPVVEFVAGVLDRGVAAGEIAPIDTEMAAAAFMSMVVGGQARTIERGRMPTQAELDDKVEFTVGILLNGLRNR
jgi:TetR/AcrR family transcriptional repressor of mexJK operon